MHKEAVHLLSLQLASITSSSAFEPECNGLAQFKEDTGRPSMPVREFNLIACLLVQSVASQNDWGPLDILILGALHYEPCHINVGFNTRPKGLRAVLHSIS